MTLGAAATSTDGVRLDRWTSAEGWARGNATSCRVDDATGDLIGATPGVATWTSPVVEPGFTFTELVPSWVARTPPGTWIEVTASVRDAAGSTWSRDFIVGRWSEAPANPATHRTSVSGQADALARADADTVVAADGVELTAWRLTVGLHRDPEATEYASLASVGAVASNSEMRAAAPGRLLGSSVRLDMPAYSQRWHLGEYSELDGGGASWCSPTSTSMVLAYWQHLYGVQYGPRPGDYDWRKSACPHPWVDFAAQRVFDHAYGGAGNWAFNTAYAGTFGHDAFVTRLRSLNEAELFVRAQIPLVVSVSFSADELRGAGYSTRGHLMVLAGFDEHGHPFMHDPASHEVADDDQVPVTYDRVEFDRAWAWSGRLAYVIRPPDVALPDHPGDRPRNW